MRQRPRSKVAFHLPAETNYAHPTVINNNMAPYDKDLNAEHIKVNYQNCEKGGKIWLK